jgi:hypothetical protein
VRFLARHDGYAYIPGDGDLGIHAIHNTFCVLAYRWILSFMQDKINHGDTTRHATLEYRKGCPACEHSDPELERELQAFAQLLLDIYLAKRAKKRDLEPSPGIDNTPQLPTLK